jgi:hypothetical protein
MRERWRRGWGPGAPERVGPHAQPRGCAAGAARPSGRRAKRVSAWGWGPTRNQEMLTGKNPVDAAPGGAHAGDDELQESRGTVRARRGWRDLRGPGSGDPPHPGMDYACGCRRIRTSTTTVTSVREWSGTTASCWSTSCYRPSSRPVMPAHDVVLVGGGGAGLRAAIAIAEANPAWRRGRLQGLPDAQPYGLGRGRRGRCHPRGRQPRRARLRHHLRRRLAERPGRRRRLRREAPRGAAPPGALGLPVEPRAGRPRRRAPVRRHEDDAHVVRRRQDRLPHAPHALPDLAQVSRPSSATTNGSSPAAGRRWTRAGRGGDRRDVGEGRDDHGGR